MKMKTKKRIDDDYLNILLNNPHIKKQLIEIGKGKGEAGKFMKKIREGKVSDKEIVDWIKKDFKKTLKAFKK